MTAATIAERLISPSASRTPCSGPKSEKAKPAAPSTSDATKAMAGCAAWQKAFQTKSCARGAPVATTTWKRESTASEMDASGSTRTRTNRFSEPSCASDAAARGWPTVAGER